MPRKKGYKSKYPNVGTIERIRDLAAYREQHMKETGGPPVWTAACYRIGVNLRTVLLGKYRPRTAPNLETVKKIRAMAEYREEHRDQLGRPPTWTKTCRKFHMNYRTLRRHARELLEKWNNPEFHG
jgi:hypothetical protein